jgi:hypothetical protein
MGYPKEDPTSLFEKWGLYVFSVDSPQLKVAGYLLAPKQSQKSALLYPKWPIAVGRGAVDSLEHHFGISDPGWWSPTGRRACLPAEAGE